MEGYRSSSSQRFHQLGQGCRAAARAWPVATSLRSAKLTGDATFPTFNEPRRTYASEGWSSTTRESELGPCMLAVSSRAAPLHSCIP